MHIKFCGPAFLAAIAVPAMAFGADVMMSQAFGQLMKSDCGSSSLFSITDGLIVDDIKSCNTLKPEMHITQVERLPLFGNADALPAMVAACAARGVLRLATKTGQALTIACGKPAYPPAQQFCAADIERVLGSLERAAPSAQEQQQAAK
jgi:hypothetical protein